MREIRKFRTQHWAGMAQYVCCGFKAKGYARRVSRAHGKGLQSPIRLGAGTSSETTAGLWGNERVELGHHRGGSGNGSTAVLFGISRTGHGQLFDSKNPRDSALVCGPQTRPGGGGWVGDASFKAVHTESTTVRSTAVAQSLCDPTVFFNSIKKMSPLLHLHRTVLLPTDKYISDGICVLGTMFNRDSARSSGCEALCCCTRGNRRDSTVCFGVCFGVCFWLLPERE